MPEPNEELDTTMSEIEDLLGSGTPEEPVAVEEPAVEEPAVDEAPVEEPSKEEPVEEPIEEPVEEVEEPAPAKEPAPEPTPTPTPAPDIAGVTAMRKRLVEMAARAREAKQPATPAAPKAPISEATIEFITQEEFNGIFENRELLNKALTRVYNRGLEDGLRSMPDALGQQVTHQVTMAAAAQEFFRVNQDLLEFRPYLSDVAARVEAENPELDYASLFQKIEETARAELMLPKSGVAPQSAPVAPKGGDPRPAPVQRPVQAPGTSGSRNTPRPPTLSGQEKEMADVLGF